MRLSMIISRFCLTLLSAHLVAGLNLESSPKTVKRSIRKPPTLNLYFDWKVEKSILSSGSDSRSNLSQDSSLSDEPENDHHEDYDYHSVRIDVGFLKICSLVL